MSKAYRNDFQRSQSVDYHILNRAVWTIEDIEKLQDAFNLKNQFVLPASRIFVFNGEGYRFNALIVNRYQRADIEEYLFSQRIEFYEQSESSENVALIMIKETPAEDILKNIKVLAKLEVSE